MPDGKERLPALVGRLLGGRAGRIASILFLTVAIAFAGYRTVNRYAQPSKSFDFAASGMSDFHNGSYFPTQAFLQGINPYALEVREHFPMARSTPPYSPVVFLLYSPFSFLDLPAADVAFFLGNFALMGLLAWMCALMTRRCVGSSVEAKDCLLNWIGSDLTATFWLWGWLTFSRPGHITLFTGYFTLQLVLGTVLALHFANRRPWLSALGMLLASGKPTYILPLTALMLARRYYQATILGLVLCAIVAGGGIAWLATHSDLGSVVSGIQEGQAAFDDDPTEDPKNTWTRLDLMGMVAKIIHWKPDGKTYLAAMLISLAPICLILFVRSKQPSDQSQPDSAVNWAASICYLTLLLSIYHHSYDGLLASVTWAGLVLGGYHVMPHVNRRIRCGVLGLLTVPAVNYAATLRFRELVGIDNQSTIGNVIASVNGICLLLALLLLLTPSSSQNRELHPSRL